MAKYNLDNYLEKDGLGFPLNFRRGNPNPLDNSSVWDSFEAAQNYAQTDPTAYVGQILSVVEYTPAVTDDEGAVTTPSQSTVEVYYIKDEAGTLEVVGTSPVGDDSTIAVAEDGTVSLYGIDGLELTRTEEDGSTTNITYQPLYVNGKLTWVEPSATTVEGLATEIEGLKTRISALEVAVGDEESGLVKDVADNATAIEALNEKAHEHSNADVIDGITAEQVAAWDKAEENAKSHTDELANGAVKDNTDAIAAIKDGQELDSFADVETAIENIDTKIGTVTEGKTVVQMIADAQDEATYDDTVLTGRVDANEAAITKLNANAETEGSVDYKIAQAVAAIMENPDETMNSINELVTWINGHAESALELSNQVETNKGDIAALEELVGTTGVADQIAAKIEETLKIDGVDKYALATDLTAAIARIVVLEGKAHEHANKDVIDGITAEKVAAWDSAESNAKSHADSLNTTMSGRVDAVVEALEGKVSVETGKSLVEDTLISKLEGIEAGAQVNKIETVDETQFAITDRNLTLLDIAIGKVTGLQDALDGKADKGTTLAEYGISDAYTKTETEARIQEVLDGLSDTSETAASVAQALETYKTSNDQRVTEVEAELETKVDAETGKSLVADTLIAKLEAIEEGAQVNKIENIKVGETLLDIVEKTVVIPVGAGLKASEEVTIAEDGTLGVGSVNVNKLVQSDGEELILNGGSSAK